MKDNIA